MTAETDQTAGQLDEATVLRVLEMVQEMNRDVQASIGDALQRAEWGRQSRLESESRALLRVGDRLIHMYRASLGLEEA